MYKVILFAADQASLPFAPIYYEGEHLYSCVTYTDDIAFTRNCYKATTKEQAIAMATQFPAYTCALVTEEFTTIDNDNHSKVKLHTISPNYTWQDVDSLYSLLLTIMSDAEKRQAVVDSSCVFMSRLMCDAVSSKYLFQCYTVIVPAYEIHMFLLDPVNYVYPYSPTVDIAGRMGYAYSLLKKEKLSYIEIIYLNRALTEVQLMLYPPVCKELFDGMPIHRTLAQQSCRAIADWCIKLFLMKDEERRKREYASIVDDWFESLLMFYLQSFYNDLTLYGDFGKVFHYPSSLEVDASMTSLKRLKVYLFACTNEKKAMESFVKKNKLVCKVMNKAGMFVVDEPVYEQIKGNRFDSIEECVRHSLHGDMGVFWTTYRKRG